MTLPEFTSREAIHAHQIVALRRLLHAAADNPFYGPRLQKAGLTGEVSDLDEFFRKMPFTHKSTLVEDHHRHPPYGTNLTYPLSAYTRFTQTSASSGAPLRWLDTPASWQWMLDNWKQVFRAAQVAPHDCLYFAFSFGPFLGFWTAFEAACQLGCRSIPGGGLSSLARLQAIQDNRVDVLLCTPTYALRLAEVAAAESMDLGDMQVRTIIVAGEPGGSVPAVRQRIERDWPRATVFDHHGMTEVGPVSYQCPNAPCSLLVMESSYIAEIVDPHGDQPVGPGTVGELVLTTLGRLGSPLIRYRTGDLVRQGPEIAARNGCCETVLRGGILGRTDDMLLVRGMNIYPPALDDLLRSLPEVAEYQVEIDTRSAMTELQLRVETTPATADDAEVAVRVQSRLRAAFNLRIPVTVCPPGTLPRSEMKSRRWIRTRSGPAADKQVELHETKAGKDAGDAQPTIDLRS